MTDQELVKALAGMIHEEGLTHEMMEILQKANHLHEEIPEKYIRTLVSRAKKARNGILSVLFRNLDLWFSHESKIRYRGFLHKAERENPPILTQEQMDELRRLIESHFRHAIGVSASVPPEMQKKWDRMGIQQPKDTLDRWIVESYVAGRLADILNNHSTYEEMRNAAKHLPISRMDQLVLEAAKQHAAKYVTKYGRTLADIAEDVLAENHQKALNEIVQQYFSGKLTHTLYNEGGFTPQEVQSLLSTKKQVKGWRELATELKNRFKAVDRDRDWDRVAISETRYATNLGRLVNIQIEGGGNANEIEVYYHVQPTACSYCKKLYLNTDGTPKTFKLSEILHNVQETGGMNIDRKASQIGERGGWVPNALTHPHCQCYPVRLVKKLPSRKGRGIA